MYNIGHAETYRHSEILVTRDYCWMEVAKNSFPNKVSVVEQKKE